jgi:hypothetical protein
MTFLMLRNGFWLRLSPLRVTQGGHGDEAAAEVV